MASIGVEIGGTFTDMVWQRDDGSLAITKVPSTPTDIHQAVMNAIAEAGVDLSLLDTITHGSTVATNALLTRKGARTALITTMGFRDVIEIGTHARIGNIYEIFYQKPVSPIRRNMICEVSERVTSDGAVREPLDLENAWTRIEPILADGVDAVAICLLHAYRNPVHEKQLVAMLKERAPHVLTSASHEVSPEFREYERTMTTVVNAFVGPAVARYIGHLDGDLKADGYGGGLRIMQSNGGIMPVEAAPNNAVRMLLSGPAAGVQAAAWFARRNGLDDIITLDMGGTSTDVAIAPNAQPRMVSEFIVDDLPIRTSAIDMVSVGAGGGSIAALDAGGFLAVGPQSAGAVPGPACYGRGGDLPTVTDAQVIAGLLRPARFFGGKLALRADWAARALESLDLPGDVRTRADAVLRMANSNMASAVRQVSTARGIDPRTFTLVAYGGGGPVHGAFVAEELGMSRVLIPWSPGLTSAFGLLIADTVIDVVRTRLQPLTDKTFDEEAAADFHAACRETAASNGLTEGDYVIQTGADLRYVGQATELTVWPDQPTADAVTLRTLFEEQHRSRYGYARAQLEVEVVGYRGRLGKPGNRHVSTPLPVGGVPAIETGEVLIGGQTYSARFLERTSLPVDETLAGPAVIEEMTSTVVVPVGWTAVCLPTGDLLLERDNHDQ